jgi:hypothetical protein
VRFAKGLYAQILAGKTVPKPLGGSFVNQLRSVQVTQTSNAASGFQLVFESGRGVATSALAAFAPFNRVVVMVIINGIPEVLVDGYVTHQELIPATQATGSAVAITGEDATVMMDLEEKIASFPAQNDMLIATSILARYAKYGLVPSLQRPAGMEQPLPTQRIPVQHATDLAQLRLMAARYGFVFHVTPTIVPMVNTAYWGPPQWKGSPQPALSMSMNNLTNVRSLSFTYDTLAPETVSGTISDPSSGKPVKIAVDKSTVPALSKQPALKANQPNVRKTLLGGVGGYGAGLAKAKAQGLVDRSTEHVVVAEGEVSVLDYGTPLRAKQLVAVRGTSSSYDGLYYVERATHVLRRGTYDVSFRLTREGTGSTLLRVSA